MIALLVLIFLSDELPLLVLFSFVSHFGWKSLLSKLINSEMGMLEANIWDTVNVWPCYLSAFWEARWIFIKNCTQEWQRNMEECKITDKDVSQTRTASVMCTWLYSVACRSPSFYGGNFCCTVPGWHNVFPADSLHVPERNFIKLLWHLFPARLPWRLCLKCIANGVR